MTRRARHRRVGGNRAASSRGSSPVREHDLVLVARDRARLEALAARPRARRTARSPRCSPPTSLTDAGSRRSRPASPTATARSTSLVNNAGFGTFGQFSELDIEKETDEIRLNVLALVRLTHAALAVDGAHAARRGRQRLVARRVPADARQRDLRRDEGVREQLHPGGARGARARGVDVHGRVPGLHPHRVPRARGARRAGRARTSCGRRPTRWSPRRSAISIGSRAVSFPGVLNRTLAAFVSVTPSGITRRVAGLIVKRSQ